MESKCEGAQGGGARLALERMSANACIAGVCAASQQICGLSKKSVRTFLTACSILWELYQGPFPYVFPILSKCKFHGNCVFGILRSLEFLLLYCHEYFVRNNSFTRVRIEIPLHEAIVFNLNCASADCLLEQYPPSIFFVREQFVDCFPIPFGPASGGGDTLLFNPAAVFPRLSPTRYRSNIQCTTLASSGFTVSSLSGFA